METWLSSVVADSEMSLPGTFFGVIECPQGC